MIDQSYGKPSDMCLLFYYLVKDELHSVRCYTANRAAMRRLLKKWRQARVMVRDYYTKEGWGGVPVPCVIRRREIKKYSLRWLACHKVVLLIKKGDSYRRFHYFPASYEITAVPNYPHPAWRFSVPSQWK